MYTVSFPRFLKYCLSCLIPVILAGCITTSPIQKLPISSETFRSPNDKLRADYPEIAEYEKDFRGFMPNTPYAQQLITEWGEPDETRTEWSYAGYMGATLIGCGFFFGPVSTLITTGLVIGIRPYPPEYFYWRKENYCIEAKFDHTFDHAYKNRMLFWRWHNMSDGKEIPTECRKQDITRTVDLTDKAVKSALTPVDAK